jgi:hypothetical protein
MSQLFPFVEFHPLSFGRKQRSFNRVLIKKVTINNWPLAGHQNILIIENKQDFVARFGKQRIIGQIKNIKWNKKINKASLLKL